MTFLNPLVLFGMIAAAIPVILHLLNLRKLRTIEFSTLRFLKELQQTKIRKLKIRQIILLIIRTLLVLAIVLAFARPAMRGSLLGKIGANAHSSVVFIVDDSFSMNARDEHGELLKQEKDNLARLMNVVNEGDEFFLIKLSDLPSATIGQGTHDVRALRTILNEIQPSSVTRQVSDAIRLSAKLLSQSKNANKEVYVLSDMQETIFEQQIASAQQVALFGPNVKFFLMNLGSSVPSNVAVDSVEVTTQILEKDSPVSVYTSVRNYGNNALQNYVVSVFLEGVRVAQNSVRLDPWASASLEFSITPKKSGFLKGYIELEQDAIEQDNRRYFTLYVPEKVSLALVANTPADTKFLSLALQSGGAQEQHSLFDIQTVTPKEFQFLNTDKLDVVALVFPDGLTAAGIDKIKDFVHNGGGLALFPSSNFQYDNGSASLLAALSLPPIEAITGSEKSQSSLSFKEVDFDHPIFSTVFESNTPTTTQSKMQVESPLILKTLRRNAGKEGHPVISLSDGSAFLSEHKFGNGKILFFSVAPTLLWSDFPVKGIFPPLIYRSAMYSSLRGKTHFSFLTGDEPILMLPNLPLAQRTGIYKIIAPDGVEELISQTEKKASQAGDVKTTGSGLAVNLKKLSQPGFYQFMNQSELLTLIAVNTDKRESDGRKIEGERLENFWKQFGIESSAIRHLTSPDEVQQAVVESRFGVELWKYCLFAAFLLALLEMFLARDSRKEMQQALSSARA